MIETAHLSELIGASRLSQAHDAIVATLAGLILGVKVEKHPGKLDIADIVARKIVNAPGVAVGWTRARPRREIDGRYYTEVDWAAYIVVEDLPLLAEKRRVDREVVGHAIGDRIVRILQDDDAASWGLTDIEPPAADQPIDVKPLLTVKSYEKGAAFFVVSWRQALLDQGASLFAKTTGVMGGDEAALDVHVDYGEESVPYAIAAMVAEAESGEE